MVALSGGLQNDKIKGLLQLLDNNYFEGIFVPVIVATCLKSYDHWPHTLIYLNKFN